MVRPGVLARLDRYEAVMPVVVGQAAPGPGEIGVQRRVVVIDGVAVAAGRVCLPDLDQLVPDRPSRRVGNPAAYDDALAYGLAFPAAGQVAVRSRTLLSPNRGPRRSVSPSGIGSRGRLGARSVVER